MMHYAGSDRREFFRINDTVVVDYKVIEKQQVAQAADRVARASVDDETNEKAQLRAIQNAFSHLVDQINHHDREVARALRMLDDKINLVSQSMQRYNNPINPDDLTEANLSGGGIAFMVDEAVPIRDHVELHLQLLPTANTIHALATVISCERLMGASPDKPYHLRMVFTHMDEQDRNQLVKHTLNRQAEMLRGGVANESMSLREF
ncbi:PilZ domain-containing protein [uncultured Methylophaga sp.]|jgi:c-di-GMP-binding flagellar brake protein YcgR|uniref:PilZ domain-containing protein n=1 Tax=uncultured Methylophaga sp. TaxID=285271 RepID=UPI00262924D9|nr:PilZ domain-containing protein [uncultured Methylophaga sp.]